MSIEKLRSKTEAVALIFFLVGIALAGAPLFILVGILVAQRLLDHAGMPFRANVARLRYLPQNLNRRWTFTHGRPYHVPLLGWAGPDKSLKCSGIMLIPNMSFIFMCDPRKTVRI